MHMNSHEGKAILALIREGDYAHAGEEESIRLVLDHVPQSQTGAILDVGCGRGGTADYTAFVEVACVQQGTAAAQVAAWVVRAVGGGSNEPSPPF